jgi:tRNA pseudouridine38-40 synthase
MREASRIFIGRHDFGSFANGYYSPEKRLRHVFRIRIMRIPHVKSGLAIRVVGSGFLHRMVRRMVGALVDVGRGRYDIEDLKKILADRSLQSTYTIAPASGLYMARVKYITEE